MAATRRRTKASWSCSPRPPMGRPPAASRGRRRETPAAPPLGAESSGTLTSGGTRRLNTVSRSCRRRSSPEPTGRRRGNSPARVRDGRGSRLSAPVGLTPASVGSGSDGFQAPRGGRRGTGKKRWGHDELGYAPIRVRHGAYLRFSGHCANAIHRAADRETVRDARRTEEV
jgi:hypothetical protein